MSPNQAFFLTVIGCLLAISSSYFIVRLNMLKPTLKQNFLDQYPDTDDQAYKAQQSMKQAYFNASFYKQAVPLTSWLVLLFFLSIGGCLTALYLDTLNIAIRLLGSAFIFIAFLYLKLPTFQAQHTFWKAYLQAHPENELKVVILPLDSPIQQRRIALLTKFKCCTLVAGLILFYASLFL